jgi:hypothetical protein
MGSGSPLGVWPVFGDPRGAREILAILVKAEEGNEEARLRSDSSLATRPCSEDFDLVGQVSGTKRLVEIILLGRRLRFPPWRVQS